MNQLRLDPLSGRWVTVSTDRGQRHGAFLPRQPTPDGDDVATCPFCPGNEGDTLPALEVYGQSENWIVRVVPNRYPAFKGDTPFVVEHRGPVFTEAPASGIHEVLVLSPDHDRTFASLPDDQLSLVMAAIRDRIEEHQGTPGLRYSQALVNHGRQAGASVSHPHGQLLGIPFVPREIADEQAGFARFAGGCLLCAAAASEERVGYRVLDSTDELVMFTPFWSGTPYELLVVPREHGAHLHRAPTSRLVAVGKAIRTALLALTEHLGDIAYNIVLHSAPYKATGMYHWHVHVLPNLTTRAGFELGTGVLINVVSPEKAAEDLRDALEKIAMREGQAAS
ncbi:MAG: galactose-1-phosphate uridylyltransferase [Acidimicrobiales bacterium]